MATETTCIITGATSGLGLELTKQLSRDLNFHVIGVSRGMHTQPEWNQLISSGRVEFIKGNVSEPATVLSAFDAAERAGRLELIVNCAGIGAFGPPDSYTSDDVDAVLGSNLIGMILFSNEAFRRMRNSEGMIINVMSTAAQIGRANESVYCAAKWGARGYTEALRLELKSSKLKVIAVYPGGMKTAFWAAKGAQTDGAGFMQPAAVADIIVSVIKKREGTYVSDIIINRG